MKRLCDLSELLLRLLFAATRTAFLLQALAFGAAAAALLAVAPDDAPPWLARGLRSGLLLSGLFAGAGALLTLASRWRPQQRGAAPERAEAWLGVLAVGLLAVPLYTAFAAAELGPLWREIGARLDSVGFWDALSQGGQSSGALLLPILLALLVPSLVTAGAAAGVALPLGLLPSLGTRSRRLPALLAMSAVSTSTFIATGWITAAALARLAEAAAATMLRAEDAEVEQLAGELLRLTGVLVEVSVALLLPALALAAGAALLRPAGALASLFTEPMPEAPRAAPEPALLAGTRSGPLPDSDFQRRDTPPAREAAPPPRTDPPAAATAPFAPWFARRGLIGLGAALLLFGAADATRTRARFVSAEPAPRARLEAGPAAVRIRVEAALDPASSLHLTRIASAPGEVAEPIEVAVRIAADDATGRTLEAGAAPLARGLYHVQWSALPAGGGVSRHGSFAFGVDVDVPPDAAGAVHSLVERDSGARGRLHVWLGGALLLALGLGLSHLSAGGGRPTLNPLARSGPRRPAASRR